MTMPLRPIYSRETKINDKTDENQLQVMQRTLETRFGKI